MKIKHLTLALAVPFIWAPILFAQSTTPTPKPEAASVRFVKALNQLGDGEVSIERREQAYAKLFEAQRLIWRTGRLRSESGINSTSRAAQVRIVSAIESNPKLAEGYTALAELMISTTPADLDEAIALAEIAVKVDSDNYGGRRILGRLYTFKSRIASDRLDPHFTEKAIESWKELTRLDPRNAEAWAFLSTFYERTDKPEQQIDALKKWLSSATPIETQFYTRVMGGENSLSPEDASMKLAPALIKAGREREAIEVLSNLIADSPDNLMAVELLRDAVSAGGGAGSSVAIEALQQAAFANPGNASLITLLADVQFGAGRIEAAAKLLRTSAAEFVKTSPAEAGNFLIVLGDLYREKDRFDEAITAYEDSLKIRGFDGDTPVTDADREFVMTVFEKLIKTYGVANRRSEVDVLIARVRKMLGQDDLFADLQSISFYRETGQREQALTAVRSARSKNADDFGLKRLEATILTELGRVDEAVSLIKAGVLADKPAVTGKTTEGSSSVSVRIPTADEFSDKIFVSTLYSRAGRMKEAAAAANDAFKVARDDSRKQIAKLTLASAQQTGGDFEGAEATLREILRETPGNPIALNNLGYFLLERDTKFDEALRMINQAVEIDPTNPSYLDSLGWAHYKLGNYAEAERHLKAALRNDPSSATINEHLGDLYFKQGKKDLAPTYWQRALLLASDEVDIGRLKGKIATTTK